MSTDRSVSVPARQAGISRPILSWVVCIGLLAVVGAFLAHAISFWGYTVDDAFITFRYSRMTALGNGPYFNVGEHVEGYTNFLLMLLLVPAYWVGGEAAVPVFAKLIGVMSGAGSVLLAWALTRALLEPHERLKPYRGLIGVAAAAVIAACPQYVINTTSGLETALYGFLVILSVYLWRVDLLGRRRVAARIACGALVLCRPEGSLLFAVCWFGQVYATGRLRADQPTQKGRSRQPETAADREWRRLLLDGVIVTGVFGALLLFRMLAYDGELLPNTYYAKLGGFWKSDPWPYIRSGLGPAFFHETVAGVGVLAALLWSWRAPSMLPVWLISLAGALLPFVTGTDWMLGFRFVVPYLPVLACVVTVGWAVAAGAVLRKWPVVVPIALLICAPVLAYRERPAHDSLHDIASLRSRGYETGHREAAEWLSTQGNRGDGTALMDIGIVGYYCIDQFIIDITGLTDKFIARSEGQFLRKRYDPKYVLDREPRFIVLTLTAPGESYSVPHPSQRFQFWTIIEHELFSHPEFRRRYIQHQQPAPWDEDWKAALAARYGAVRIFEHGYPGAYYLLAVFEAK